MASITDVIEALKYTYGVDQVQYSSTKRWSAGICSRRRKSLLGGVGNS